MPALEDIGMASCLGMLAACLILGFLKPRAALAGALLTMLAAGVTLTITEDEGATPLRAFCMLALLTPLPAAFLSTLLWFPKADEPLWPKGLAIGFWLLAGFVFLAWLSLLAGPYGLLLFALTVATVIRCLLIWRSALAADVIAAAGACVRQNLPLATALEAQALSSRGRRRRVLKRMVHWLSQGLPLSEALRRSCPQCPASAIATIAAAEPIHQVPLALGRLEARMCQEAGEASKFRPVNPGYLLPVLGMMVFLVVTVGLFVLPKFELIFRELDVQLPAVTKAVFHGAAVGAEPLALLGLAGLGTLALWVYAQFRRRRPQRPCLLSRLGDWIKWRLPPAYWMERTAAIAETAGLLRLCLQADCTVDQAIAAATELDVNLSYRRRLRKWLRQVREGRNVVEAARTCRVGRMLAGAFDENVHRGNAPEVLRAVETVYRDRHAYAANLVRSLLWPAATLATAALVACIVLAVFLPLINLIQATMQSAIP